MTTDTGVSDADYNTFRLFLERRCGIVLGDNKQYLVRSRLSPLLRKFEKSHLTDLLKEVTQGHNSALQSAVVDAMTTNETLWFRDSYPFDLLKNSMLSELSSSKRSLRVWCAACSSGQEPYSIAMVIREFLQSKPGAFGGNVEIVGTDISSEMLERCQSAQYDSLSLSRGLSAERKQRFFSPLPSGDMQLKDEVSKMVKFRQFNLLDSFTSLGSFDMVFCRNVLIYFSSDVKAKILQQIAACLPPGGILFLGASESMSGLSDQFKMVRAAPGLFYVKNQ